MSTIEVLSTAVFKRPQRKLQKNVSDIAERPGLFRRQRYLVLALAPKDGAIQGECLSPNDPIEPLLKKLSEIQPDDWPSP